MRKCSSGFGRTLRLALLGANAVLTGCSPTTSEADVPRSSGAPEWSIPDSTGRLVSAHDFRGRVVALYFGFTNCPEACPTALSKLAVVRSKLGQARVKLQGIFITIDPERDSSERALEFARTFDASFIALRPSPQSVEQVADAFQVFFRRDGAGADYSVSHSGLIYIYDCSGRRVTTIRPELSVADMERVIRKWTAERSCLEGH